MAEISSFNMKQSTDFQVFHNANIRPSYAIGGELECNRKGYEAKELKETIINKAKQAYVQRTKRAFQAKSYEWSAVVNIKPDTTMQDLENLAKHFNDKYGFQCYQIAIHRDEGHIDENGQKQINHHAHLEFITLDKETGKNRQREIKPQTLRQIQTETAQILQMQRGVDKRISKTKRIEPRKYAQLKEQEKENLKKQKELLKHEKAQNDKTLTQMKENATKSKFDALSDELELITTKKQIKERIEQERKAWIAEQEHTADDYKALRELKAELEKALETEKEQAKLTIERLNNEILKLKNRLDKEKKEKEQTEKALKEQETKINILEGDLSHERAKNEKLQTQEQENILKAENEKLKMEKAELIEIFSPTMRKWERDANYIEKFDVLMGSDTKQKAFDTAIASDKNLKRLDRLGAYVYKTADKVAKMINTISKKLNLTLER